MKKRLKILILCASAIVMLTMETFVFAVATMPGGPTPTVSTAVVPVKPKPVVPAPVVPKAVVPAPVMPKSMAPKPVMPVPVTPKVAPVTPVMPKSPVAVAPKVMPVKPVVASPAASKPVAASEQLASQVVGIISVKNSSKYSASWTGWKTKYKTLDGKIHYKLHHLKVAHQLQPSGKHKVAKTLQGYTVHNLPEQSFVEGVSDLMIDGQPVSVEYKGSAWMPGVTDAIYVTSSNGATWILDKKAMDKDYKKINSGIKKSKSFNDDSISKVTDDTKAATVSVVLKDKKNQKKFKNIARKGVSSKASQAFDHAIDTKSA